MAKTLAKVAMIAGAIALVATGVGAAGSAGLLSMSASTAATVSTVAQVATVVAAAASVGAQVMAKKPGLQGSVNQVTIGANSPIPYGVGRSFYAGTQLHDVGYGGKVGKTKNPYLSKVFVWSAGGPIDGVESLLLDWQAVSFAGTSALGYYASWLYADHQLGLRPEPDALAGPWGAVPDWSPAHKMSGMCASMLNFRFDRDNKVWANGIPAFGVVARWARVYDPRKDSTYPGGDGDHRFDYEDSFEFDRNAALNAITYARGRYAIDPATGEQTIKVIGCGFPYETFDWPQWVAFANVCEANGWNSDGTVFDGPGLSLWDNLKRICAAGAGVPVISGGLLSVRFQSPKVALDTITRDDFADGERMAPGMRTWKDRINTMVPKYRSETNKWEYVQSAAVRFEDYIALDGEPKEEEFLCELVTDKDQAAQLTAYELMNRRELAGITYPCKPRLWYARLGEAYHVSDPDAGLDHLCVVAAISKDISTSTVTLTFETEDTAKHAVALAMTGTAPPPPTLVPPGDSDDASWDNGGAGTPDTPTGWSMSVEALGGSAGVSIVVTGSAASSNAEEITFEYRPYDAGNGAGDNWIGASLEPSSTTTKVIAGISAGVGYEVSVRYRVAGNQGARQILGPESISEWAAAAVIADGGNTTVTAAGDDMFSIVRSLAGPGWDASAVSTSGFTGNAVARIIAPQAASIVIAGLSAAPNATDDYAVDFGFFFDSGGVLKSIEGGGQNIVGSWVPGDVLWVVQSADGSAISYWQGAELRSAALLRSIGTSAATLYFDSSIYTDAGAGFSAGLFQRRT